MDVDAPQFRVESEGLQGPLAAELLDLVDVDRAAVITGAGIAFRIFVVETRAEGRQARATAKVLRGDQLQATNLAVFLLKKDGGRRKGGEGGRGWKFIKFYQNRSTFSTI